MFNFTEKESPTSPSSLALPKTHPTNVILTTQTLHHGILYWDHFCGRWCVQMSYYILLHRTKTYVTI